jgi:predicted DCC family thiol-disulfide oxidoreductase YuxK
VRFIFRHDVTRRLRYAALQTRRGRTLADRHGLEADTPSSFYIVLQGEAQEPRILSGAAALRYAAQCLTWPWRTLAVFTYLPEPVVNGLYGFVVRNRYRIAGRRETCFVPTPEERERFLS